MKTHRPVLLKSSALTCSALVTALSATASTDYGPAVWNPLPDYATTGNGHKFHVVHDMEGYYANCYSALRNQGLSVHYAINSKQDSSSDAPAGQVSQFVRDAYYGFHAYCWNYYSSGTEHEGFASNPAWFTETMYQASASLTRHLASVYGWAKDRNHIVGHGEKSNAAWCTYCEANFGCDAHCNSHTDPGPYWDWAHYMDLINGTSRRIDVFVRATDNSLRQKTFDGTQWSSTFANLGGTLTADPAAVSWGPNRIDVFGRNTAGDLVHKWWNGSAWSSYETLGGDLQGGPDVCSWAVGRLDVFTRGNDNALKHIYYVSGSGWSAWESLGGNITSDPSAVSWGSGRIDVFARGSDGSLVHKWYVSGSGWFDWQSLGGTIVGGPDAASWAAGRLDVFVRATDNTLRQLFFSNGDWAPSFTNLGGAITSDPSAVSYGSGRIDVFARGSDGSLQHKWFGNDDWSGWESLGGTLVGGPDASAWSN